MRDDAAESLRALVEVVERLRAPGGCPWDRQQTHRSLRPYLLEETYELLEAIEGDDRAALREELGDVLLQVLMHAAISAEGDGGFDLGDVAETTRAKMIHRHPHVFADVAVDGAAAVVVNWERLKRAEKGERLSLLDGVPRTLPALAHAQGIQKRPARLGFDETPAVADAVAQLRDAIARAVDEAAARPAPRRGEDWAVSGGDIGAQTGSVPAGHGAGPPPAPPVLEEAVGDVLFAAVALARRLRVNPEDALRARTDRFAQRFRRLEQRAREDGVDLHDIDEAEWRRRWEAISET
ncbi:MAG: nucleoside triphosphate pyrophosphohydrolase [Candidatus Dormibacteria bacterium]